MTRRIGSVTAWLMILTLTLGSGALGAMAQQGAAGEALFSADGIDATILAQADIADLDAASSVLLELIELAPDAELATRRTTSPELFYVLAGVVTFADEFGFVSAIDAGRVVSLNAGTAYTLSNADSETGRLLRARLAGGATATPGATPAAAAGDGTMVLMQAPLEGVELEGARIFLARAQFGANADSGEQGHTGPLGIYVDSGTLNVVSPSGLVGGIEAGRAVSLPGETPLRASTGETEAVVFFAGVAGTEGDLFTRNWTEADGPAPGTALEAGQTWTSETAEMAVTVRPFTNVVRFELIYTNTGQSVADVDFDRNLISVTDDRGGEWGNPFATCESTTELAPAEAFGCTIQFNPPSGTDRGPMVLTIHVAQFGEIKDAAWQMEIDW